MSNQFAFRLMSQRITLGFIMAMVLIASGFAISFYGYNQIRQDMGRIQHIYKVMGARQNVLCIQAKSVDGKSFVGLIPDQRYVEITVEDNGIGFDGKYTNHIFNVFQRLYGKSAFEGTGFGLFISKRVVEYHHGYFTARSQPNAGNTFVVVLPESQSLQHYDRPTSTEAYSYPAG